MKNANKIKLYNNKGDRITTTLHDRKNLNLLNTKNRQKIVSNLLKNPKFLILLFILGLLLAIFTTPLKLVFNQMYLVEYLQVNQCCVIIPFIAIYTVLTILGIPGTILTVAGGIVFGVWWGTLWSVIGATLGALGAFLTARYLLRDYIKNKFAKNKSLAKFNQSIIKNPITFVLAIRFAPISPFNVVNFLFGLTPIPWFFYTVATFFGIIPGTFAYTWLGKSGFSAIEGQDRLSLYFAIAFMSLLSLLPLCWRRNSRTK